MAVVYLGLGTNLGDRERNLENALELLGREMKTLDLSSIYETEPVGFVDQPWFLNAVCRVETNLGPHDLLRAIKRVEKEAGREPSFRWGPRTIDIDILLYDGICLSEADLEIPHPRLVEREFVLAPLREIAGDLVHPATKERIADLAARAARTPEVRLWKRRTECTK
ncbi:MAG: 2-amino-4-hydroxy-6-hydroxymethyldihydropteridine diphosphokinase [Chloroflexi bacterium]|nr:2-amino-4-hydroxy-6-hydroxymethyldihydropteridine diphosphokinase [Chloroflexota bacterium]